MRLLLVVLALLVAAPAEARELSLQQKTVVMNAVRLRLKDPTAKFGWLAVADDALYCGLVKGARSASFMPFQVFGVSGKAPNVIVATDRVTTASVRQSCQRYGYNFTQVTE